MNFDELQGRINQPDALAACRHVLMDFLERVLGKV
jgi:hypothetical protein